MSNFLPDGYSKPVSMSKYFTPSKLPIGDNKFRILSDAIVGWLDWSDKKPVRTHDKPEHSIDPKKPAKPFWAFVIWDYRDEAIKIMEITQNSIQTAIYELHSDENWGHPKNFDLNLKRTGAELETRYSVIPMPPKPINETIARFYAESKIDLNALFDGLDPFNSENAPEVGGETYQGEEIAF